MCIFTYKYVDGQSVIDGTKVSNTSTTYLLTRCMYTRPDKNTSNMSLWEDLVKGGLKTFVPVLRS